MPRASVTLFIAAVVLVVFGVMLRATRRKHELTAPAAFMQQEPPLILWAWETSEDLTGLDPRRAGVAFLARQLQLGHDLTVKTRRQPLTVAPGSWLMAVVRVEAGPGFEANPEVARRSALAIAEAARLPRVLALQIDFDATLTQRPFYRELLQDLRGDLPAGFPVSITALVSWCGSQSWLQGLPVEEAVPMFFRMGGLSATRSRTPRSQSVVQEPLCSGSVGLATDEEWPVVRSNQRVYLFRPGAWTKIDLARVNRFGYEGLRGLTPP